MTIGLPAELNDSGAIEVRNNLGTISGGDILDVGTDDGDFIGVLMKTLKDYKSFTGIDISDKEFENARERFNDYLVNFLLMNAESMTFADNQFDTVCTSYTLHHLENIEKVLAEMYRVLKPGGYFIIQEMYSDGNQTQAQLVDRDVHHLEVKVDTILGIPHFETLTRERLKEVVGTLGLSEMKTFESSWSVKCLFCDEVHSCQDPKRPSMIDFTLKQIDDTVAKVSEHASYDQLRKEADSLKQNASIEGSAAASVMYFLGRK